MYLSDEFKRASVTGISDGKALLQTVAIQSLQHLAGYTPSTLPESVYMRQVNDARPVTPSRSTSQLYRMLLGDFQFERCLPEWCLLVVEHGMRIPSELIPRMLNSDQLYIEWRKVAMLAMGSYARWIVAHRRTLHDLNHWGWVIETSPPTIASIHADIDSKVQEKIREYERARNITIFHNSLANYQYFWNDELSEVVLHHIDYLLNNIPSDRWRLDIHRIHLCFAYYAPLKYHQAYSTYLQRMREMHITTTDITEITVYRSKLLRIIAEDAKHMTQSAGGAD